MKTIAGAALCLALAAAAAHSAEAEKTPQSVRLQYEMGVGADGKATHLAPARELPEEVDQWIRKRVGAYTFKAATVNGQPQPATTTLYLTLGPVSGPDGATSYRIEGLSTGPKLVRGRYDHQPTGAGGGYFVVEYDGKGRVTKASVDQRQALLGGQSFRRWGLALARSFHFKPETVAGQAVPGIALIPIVYCEPDRTCPELARPGSEHGADLGGEMVAHSVLTTESPGS